ncbi:hypothetical protein K2173_007344 [Erythroxylum novogranatense]|uniref:Uncharacterized protein n=1 Tax=Erythroxylum novogranatense TaxID=1862640 RepID=A0AAV8T7B4_9ROSI|nr:hypothetical protein K2173_007344 [Erythroxylum novogranatense]
MFDQISKYSSKFFKTNILGYVIDVITHRQFPSQWENKNKVVVFYIAKNYTFHPNRIAKLYDHLYPLALRIIFVPIDLLGTSFCQAINSSKFIRNELLAILKLRKTDMYRKYMNESNIADKILGLLIGGHDNASVAYTFIVKSPTKLPTFTSMFIRVKYLWNVASEVIRLASPLQGAFREAINDFIFNGFLIPKGWKILMCLEKEYARLEICVFMHNLKIVVNPMPIPQKGLPILLHPHTS